MSIALIALALLAAPAQELRCTEPLPADMRSWVDPIFLDSGAMLPVGTAARVTLQRDGALRYPPAKPAAAGRFAGTLRFTVKTAGSYRVSLGAAAWIDMIRSGKPVASTAHGHGGVCAPVKKRVDFTLAPGTYTLQLSGAERPVLGVFVGPVR